MGRAAWHEEPVWLNDGRRSPRWGEEVTALVKFEKDEYLGKLRDISLDGVGLMLDEVEASAGQAVEVCVAFDDRVLAMRGSVVYRVQSGEKSRVGIACPLLPENVCDYLCNRYDGERGSPSRPSSAGD